MRVENLRCEKYLGNNRSVATVVWEDCDRVKEEVYFETNEELGDSLSCNPHAFLVACIMPAMHFSEERISIEGEVCPELKEGMINVMNWMRLWWYQAGRKLVKIEAKTKTGLSLPRTPDRAGFFFSGGIDSLATLRANRIHFPLEHPGSIKDGLLICGLEVSDPKAFDNVVSLISVLAKDANVTLIPVYTNIRSLGPTDNIQFWGKFWVNEFMGAAFSAIAHAFSKRLTSVSISSDHDIPNIYPFSSHPLINPNYASSDLKIKLEGIALSRFEKTELVSKWDLAIKYLRVCNKTEYYKSELLNCGKCEKCTRTMLAFQALGVLKMASAFPTQDVTVEQIDQCGELEPNTFFFWSQLIAPFAKMGREDLVRAIERKIAYYHQAEKRKNFRKLYIEPIIELDQKMFGGTLRKFKRRVYSKGIYTNP